MPLPLRLSEPGPILQYMSFLRSFDAKTADKVRAAVRSVLSTPDGAILLDLLEKATLKGHVPITADPRALEAINAQSFIPLDLRRILSDETEQLLSRQADKASANRPGTGRRSSTGGDA